MNGTIRKLWWSPIVAAGAGVVFAVLFFFDPSHYGFYPTCWFHRLTGLDCPGCGGLRAVHQLLHLHFVAAFRDNALFVLSLPLLAIYLTVRFLRKPLPASPGRRSGPWIWLGLGIFLVVLFGVLRNLPYPAFAWMAP